MSISSYGVLDRQTTNTERWVTFAALFLFGFTASCNLFKASSAGIWGSTPADLASS